MGRICIRSILTSSNTSPVRLYKSEPRPYWNDQRVQVRLRASFLSRTLRISSYLQQPAYTYSHLPYSRSLMRSRNESRRHFLTLLTHSIGGRGKEGRKEGSPFPTRFFPSFLSFSLSLFLSFCLVHHGRSRHMHWEIFFENGSFHGTAPAIGVCLCVVSTSLPWITLFS